MAAKEDNFLKLKQQIKSNNIGNLYLFFGEETYIKGFYLEHMKKFVPDENFADFNHIVLDGKDASPDKVDDAVSSFPMMAEKKLVVIKNSGIFKSSTDDIKEFWQAQFANLPDYILMIFDEQDVDKRSVIYKSLVKHGMAVEFNYMKDYEAAAWAAREAQKSGKKLSKDSAEHLVAMCDPGIANLKNELDKLINYCDSEIYVSDIDKVVSKPLSIVVFEITDALIAGDTDKAMSTILRMKENRESAFNILYLLSNAFDNMLHCKLLLAEGATYDVISSRLGLAPFIARKYIDGAKSFSEDFLIRRVCKTAECDLSIKQGEIDEWSALFQYVFECVQK